MNPFRLNIGRGTMKKHSIAMAFALLLTIAGSAMAAVVHVSGSGQSYDPGIALENARADANNKCRAQGGSPVKEVYNHMTRGSLWLASSIWECQVP
jgi:hypothetical protein